MQITPESIKQLRDSLDLSQAEMAQLIGVSMWTYRNWEWGKAQPQPRNRRRIKELSKELEKDIRLDEALKAFEEHRTSAE